MRFLYWTLGQFDVMTVVNAPDDATLTLQIVMVRRASFR